MISPKELKMGNLVLFNGEVKTLRNWDYDGKWAAFINEDGSISSSGFGKWIEPIPLTPDWLDRLHWSKYDIKWFDRSVTKGAYVYGPYMIEFTQDGITFGRYMHPVDSKNRYVFYRTVKYVHDVQNLIFYLTRTELTLKP